MKKSDLYHYFDYNASTPVDPKVWLEMRKIDFVNYSSNSIRGQKIRDRIDRSIEFVASMIGATVSEICFVSTASEANVLAIRGTAIYQRKADNKRNIIVSSPLEHRSVLDALKLLMQDEFNIRYVRHNNDGTIDYRDLERLLTRDVLLCTIMHVNNEIGIINDIKRIGDLCRAHDIIFHTDASQSYGRIKINVKEMNIDLLVASGHKIYAPKGIAMLYSSRLPRRIRIQKDLTSNTNIFYGSTPPTELIMSFIVASRIASEELIREDKRLRELQLYMNYTLFSNIPDIYLNGCLEHRISSNLNYSFYGIEGESLATALEPFVVSTGSACNADDLAPSHVISYICDNHALVHSSIRISLGRYSTKECVDDFILRLIEKVKILRACSPLY